MKYDRSIFIYLEPRPVDGAEDFAQCGSCRLFVPEMKRCIIHGAELDIDKDDSCGFWVPWPEGKPVQRVIDDHARELRNGVSASVTPEQSGLVDDRVQCHRCAQYSSAKSRCRLYEALNVTQPTRFDLDAQVKPHACCNAWTDEVSPAGDLKMQIRGAIRRAA